MSKIELTRSTGKGDYFTLTGMGILIELIMGAVEISGADPADVFVKFQKNGTSFDVTFPTPHTILFDTCEIKDGKFKFHLGKRQWCRKTGVWEDNHKSLHLADPEFVTQLANCITERSKVHRATKKALLKNTA